MVFFVEGEDHGVWGAYKICFSKSHMIPNVERLTSIDLLLNLLLVVSKNESFGPGRIDWSALSIKRRCRCDVDVTNKIYW